MLLNDSPTSPILLRPRYDFTNASFCLKAVPASFPNASITKPIILPKIPNSLARFLAPSAVFSIAFEYLLLPSFMLVVAFIKSPVVLTTVFPKVAKALACLSASSAASF